MRSAGRTCCSLHFGQRQGPTSCALWRAASPRPSRMRIPLTSRAREARTASDPRRLNSRWHTACTAQRL
eukprot:451093-Pleurochrysis_carterae.AAC.3